MTNPLRHLKFLPWIPLLQVTFVSTLIVTLLEGLLLGSAVYILEVRRLLVFLLSPPLGVITVLVATVGIGALSVTLTERLFYRQISLNTSTLWALMPCLMLWLLLKSFLPGQILTSISTSELAGLMIGVFWRGRPYWR